MPSPYSEPDHGGHPPGRSAEAAALLTDRHDERGKVLVTGGTGFVGSHITQALIHSGHDVRLLVCRP